MTDPATDALVVLVAAGSADEADRIATRLVEAQLAACVQATPIRSTYRWDGEVQRDDEVLLLIKTTAASFDALEAAVVDAHSYDVPEIVALPITAAHTPYLTWLTTSVDN